MNFNTDKTTKSAPEVLTLSDSDEEVFVGPVTEKEKKKAAKLSRRTQVFFPPVSWKLRSSNNSVSERAFHRDQSPLRNKDLHSAAVLSRENGQPTPRGDKELGQNLSVEEANFVCDRESPTNGYAADISSTEKTSYKVPENNSLQYGYSADSLNSLSRDSLDVDNDSLEENKKPASDSSLVEDLYDAGDYVNTHQDVLEENMSCAPKQLTGEEIEELQKQLDRFALEMRNDGAEPAEKHNNSFETEDPIAETPSPPRHSPNIETIFVENKNIPSPYDLNKQRLSDLLSFDSSFDRRSHPVGMTKDKLDTVCEASEPSSESRFSSVRLSEVFLDSPVDSPRKGSTDNLPNSTQLFEELERQIEEEESMHSNHQNTYTVCTESRADCSSHVETTDATYTLTSNASETLQEEADFSLNSCFEDSATSHDNPCPEGIFNDTIEEMEMLLKYGVDYIYGKRCKTPVNKSVSYEELPRPKSADCGSNHSGDSGRSTPKTRAKLTKAPTPVKRTPSTTSHAQRTPVKTPTSSKQPGCTVSGSASNPSRYPPRAVNPKSIVSSVPIRFDKKSGQATGNETSKFKVPAKIPVPASRVPRALCVTPRSSKLLSEIQSPIGAYIHNTPSPVLMKNVKPKPCPSSVPRDLERRHRPVWDNVDVRHQKCDGSENINPNVGHVLPPVHYIQAPCIKLDDHKLPKSRLPRLGDRFEKLLDSPCPQVIKHEGRVRVNPSSPQCTAAVEAVRLNFNDSIRSEAAAGDISVCVSKIAKRTNTLSVDL